MVGHISMPALLHLFLFYTVPVIIVLALIFYFLMRSRGGETPLDILKKGYAKGEIDSETFNRMSKEIAG